jgi:hypothetical protein
VWILFFAMLFKVGLSCIFGVLSGVSRVSPRDMRMVRGDGLLVLTATAVIDKDLMTRMRRSAISAAP